MAHSLAARDPESMALRFYIKQFQDIVSGPETDVGFLPITEEEKKRFDIFCNNKNSSENKLDLVIDSLLEKTRIVVPYLLKIYCNQAAIDNELCMQGYVNSFNATGAIGGPETDATVRTTTKFFSRRQALVLLTAANALDNKV